MSVKDTVTKLFAKADIKFNGNRPWDIQVHNPKFYARILAKGSIGFGESYMDGWWDCKDIGEMLSRVCKGELDKTFNSKLFWYALKANLLNLQTRTKSKEVGRKHYDVGNELYKLMLDKRMNYSCAYWKNAKTLDQAQEAKLDLICKKLELKPGMKVLDIGCGWGAFAKFAAQKYKVKVVGLTISKEQAKLAKENCKGLKVEIRLQDYRDVKETFDRILSIGMFEHVGYKNYRTYMKTVNRCLKDNGLTLLHTIGTDVSCKSMDPWGHKYIFPNSVLPSAKQITAAAEGFFTLEDWHNLGNDYETTLIEWHKNFTKNWNKIKKDYDEKFYRMWVFYLLSCVGIFRSRNTQLWQIVFSKRGKRKTPKIVR